MANKTGVYKINAKLLKAFQIKLEFLFPLLEIVRNKLIRNKE